MRVVIVFLFAMLSASLAIAKAYAPAQSCPMHSAVAVTASAIAGCCDDGMGEYSCRSGQACQLMQVFIPASHEDGPAPIGSFDAIVFNPSFYLSWADLNIWRPPA